MEAHPELIVHTDAMLASASAFKRFQPIAGRYLQIIQSIRDLQLPQLASRDGQDIREPLNPIALCKRLRVCTLERLDH
jgi:hypothetical protein